MKLPSHIGLIAGSKNLPFSVVEFAKKNNIKISIAGLKGAIDPNLKLSLPTNNYKEFYFTELNKTISFFKKSNVDTIIIVGGLEQAKFKITTDFITILLKLLFIKNKYDGILRLVIKEFEKAKLKVIGITDLIPSLLIEKKILTNKKPNSTQLTEIKEGFIKAKKFASTDKGQSIIVNNLNVIAVETFKGTDALIISAGEKNKTKGAILIKVLKHNQDKRVDIPIIGVNTIKNLAKYNLIGVAVEANETIIENRNETIKLANSLGIFIIGI